MPLNDRNLSDVANCMQLISRTLHMTVRYDVVLVMKHLFPSLLNPQHVTSQSSGAVIDTKDLGSTGTISFVVPSSMKISKHLSYTTALLTILTEKRSSCHCEIRGRLEKRPVQQASASH